jgi:hypothetical protein
LSKNNIKTIEKNKLLPVKESLIDLDLSENEISGTGPNHLMTIFNELAQLEKIETLDIRGNSVLRTFPEFYV